MSTFLPAIPVDVILMGGDEVLRLYLARIPVEGDEIVFALRATGGVRSLRVERVALVGDAYAAGHGSHYPAAVVRVTSQPLSTFEEDALRFYGGGFPPLVERSAFRRLRALPGGEG